MEEKAVKRGKICQKHLVERGRGYQEDGVARKTGSSMCKLPCE